MEWNQGNPVMHDDPMFDVDDGGTHYNAVNTDDLSIADAIEDFAAWSENREERTVRIREITTSGPGDWEEHTVSATPEA